MAQPAARQGDMTAHGGTIVAGDPTVLINGLPAARQGDLHVCPMCSGTVPHVGGPILQGAPTVLINGMPAARVGDMCTCTGPPDAIAMGETTVLIGSGGNPVKIGGAGQVMIGGAGPVIIGGGTAAGAGGGGGASGRQGGLAAVAAAQTGSPEATTREKHWLEFKFEDAAGNAVSGVPYRLEDPEGAVSESWLKGGGLVRRSGLSAGEGTVAVKGLTNAEWSKTEARVGEEVRMRATATGIEDGTPATVQVESIPRDSGPSTLVDEIETEVSGDVVEVAWTYPTPDPSPLGENRSSSEHGSPYYRALVRVECMPRPARTRVLSITTVLEGEVIGPEDEARPRHGYALEAPGRKVLSNQSGRDGTLKEEGVAPSIHVIG